METSEVNITTPPDLLIFDGGDWFAYQEALYEVFLNTIWSAKLTFQGLPVNAKKQPEHKGKHFAFWHLTSNGEIEEEREPDLRRCERLAWVSWVILNVDRHPEITYWENKRGNQRHIVVWCEGHNYAVILAKRNGYFLLKTAYVVDKRRAKAFEQERSKSQSRKH